MHRRVIPEHSLLSANRMPVLNGVGLGGEAGSG